MNKLVLILMFCCGLAACGGNGAKKSDAAKVEQTPSQAKKDCVEILYFHGKQRCVTCMTIETHAKEAVESHFADELRNGTVVFKSIDISKPENKKMAEKYKVSWASLFISRWQAGKETYENLTVYAFATARTAPDTFKKGVIEKIDELLK